MLKGFKDFILRGNVVDLAVGIVIGAAFTAVVTQFTKSFLEPLIRVVTLLVTGGDGLDQTAPEFRGIPFDWPAFINAAITLFLTAAVLYFLVVMPMNKLAERRKRGEEPPPAAPSEEVKLLTEIRDALVAAGRVPGRDSDALDRLINREQPPAQR
ncbi:large conductance mechanosensitive channel protein MscL [Polymorphospora sp. NPDC051019]|uniref:large conductance mechanosensitive channel protein MscL n=1 Tax=Polymorphospora sp. NPDC051019 TaxID=3155725 RepID=UPI0034379E0B